MPSTVFNPSTEGMGISLVGLGDPNVVVKRQFRWTFEIISNSNNCSFRVPPYFVKTSGRPNISFEPTEINFMNDKMWIPGKATWEPITITYMDVAGSLSGNGGSGNLALYQWLTSIFNFTSPTAKFMATKRRDYTATASLILWDGCGTALEQWILGDAWPESINFGTLDYASSDTVDIELSLRYSQVSFTHNCPTLNLQNCCGTCS
jgi:hypothetical protein